MSSVSIDFGSHDIYFDDIAEQVVADCEEEGLLLALARENANSPGTSSDPTERKFALEAVTRLRDLAQWFKENQP